jgi:prepilin-type N-terminal cleavage/methylation domain-containing protein
MKKRAFSLIELVLVVSIISLLLSIALVKLDVVNRVREKSEINSLLSDVNFCKEKARVTGFDYKLVFKENGYIISSKGESKFTDAQGNSEFRSIKVKEVETECLTKENAANTKELIFVPTGSVVNADTYKIYGKINDYELIVGVASGRNRIKTVKKEN